MTVAIILAGGRGSRAGQNIPKQFVKVLDRPILAYTLEIFEVHEDIDAVEVVCVAGWEDELWRIVRDEGFQKVKWVVEGGRDFQHSVRLGIEGLEDICTDEDMVVVHTGVAPFLAPEILSDTLRVCREKGNAISSYSMYSLAGHYDAAHPEFTDEWIDRDQIICLKNPHAFRYGFVRDMYKEAVRTGLINQVKPYTTTLMFHMGLPIYLAKGSQANLKITTQADIELFEGFVRMKKEKARKAGQMYG